MKLFEYQAKELFASHGIPVPNSALIHSLDQLDGALAQTGLPCVIKCQVLQGGRGKAGLVKMARNKQEARRLAEDYFAQVPRLKAILVEEAVDYRQELYLGLSMDAKSGQAILMASGEGGVDIEEVSRSAPEKIHTLSIDLLKGLQPFQINDLVYSLGLEKAAFRPVSAVCASLYQAFCRMDAELAEINPLFILKDGQAVAGDGKLNIDDNSAFRHPEYRQGPEHFDSPTAYEAAQEGIPYIEFGGDISLMCAGAGLTNTVFDLVNFEGGTVANYLEYGGPNYTKAGVAMRLCLANNPKVILIVTFGTIARADVMAAGIVQAIQELKPACPIVACLRGTGEERVEEIFAPVGLKQYTDTETAVRKAVGIAAQGDRT